MDDEVGPLFDQILDCAFNGQGAAIWWAQRGQEFVRITRSPDSTHVPGR